jgi:NitT/TauT family transport system substrate-binding protein
MKPLRCPIVVALGWSFLVAVMAATSAMGAEAVSVRLVTDWYPQPEHGGFYYALLKGYYREVGLDVEILPGGPNAFPVQRIATKAADFGMGSTDDVLLANDRGIPVVAVAATLQHDPQGLMVHESSPVKNFTDLEGRTVAITPGTAWFPYLIQRYGLKTTRERAHNFSIGSFLRDPDYIQMCFVTSEPFFAAEAGVKARVLLISSSGFDPYRVTFTRREVLAQHPERVRAFVTARIRGWKGYIEDPAAVHAEIRRRNPELTPAKMDYSYRALKQGNFVHGDTAQGEAAGRFSEARWRFQFKTLKDLGVLRGNFDPATAWSGEFCNATNTPAATRP